MQLRALHAKDNYVKPLNKTPSIFCAWIQACCPELSRRIKNNHWPLYRSLICSTPWYNFYYTGSGLEHVVVGKLTIFLCSFKSFTRPSIYTSFVVNWHIVMRCKFCLCLHKLERVTIYWEGHRYDKSNVYIALWMQLTHFFQTNLEMSC